MKLTAKEVASEMGISVRLVQSLASQGKLPFAIVHENKVNKTYIFDRDRFMAWKRGEL